MNHWEILGINPTSDIKFIKKAYSEKSKVYHPEENPEEFRKLHEAYKKAINVAKTMPQFKQSDAIKKRKKPDIPQFKRSFYVRKPYDNPARASFYKCSQDKLDNQTIKKFKLENQRFSKPRRHMPFKDEPEIIKGYIPIKGASVQKSNNEDSLDFSFVDLQVKSDKKKRNNEIKSDIEHTQQCKCENETNNDTKIRVIITIVIEIIWIISLVFFTLSSDFLSALKLFILYLLFQHYIDVICKSNILTAIFCVSDAVSCMLLLFMLRQSIPQGKVLFYSSIIGMSMCIYFPVYRILKRIQYIKKTY